MVTQYYYDCQGKIKMCVFIAFSRFCDMIKVEVKTMNMNLAEKRIKEDIEEIKRCMDKRDMYEAKQLLRVLLNSYQGIILSLDTAMMPTESAIYGRGHDDSKGFTENVFINLNIIKNKLELLGLSYYNDKHSYDDRIETFHIEAAIKNKDNLSDKKKEELIGMMRQIVQYKETYRDDYEAYYEKIKPLITVLLNEEYDIAMMLFKMIVQ